MKRKWNAVIMTAVVFLLIGYVYHLQEIEEENYTAITFVNGVVFDMPKQVLAQATAITGISEEEDYTTYTYVYKDGESTYLLFNMDQIIVIVDNRTTYRLQNTMDVMDEITSNSLDGIWLCPDDKEISSDIESKDDIYKLTCTVRSDISITGNACGRFVGKYTYVSAENAECSMFVGVRGKNYSDVDSGTKAVLEHIAKSLCITDCTVMPKNDREIESTVKDRRDMLTVMDNQGEVGTKYSDIYHLLSVGMTGTYFAYDKDSEYSLSSGDITIEELYTGEDAVDLIREYCNSGKAMYPYADAPEGFSWHAVKYRLSQSQRDLYTNIKLEGLDGNRLVYHGVSCTSRTYDIIYDWNSKTDLYCYYAVPNGCKEYMLECGNRYASTSETACYRICVGDSQ